MKKTNAARILDGLNIVYQLKTYPVDVTDLGAHNVAAKVGLPLAQVFKTLVVRGDKTGIILAVVPGCGELDLKALAAVSQNKRAELVHLKEVQGLTGYIRGGVSPLGTKKDYPVFLDESALAHDVISVSAGLRGELILLAPSDLVRATGAHVAALVRSTA